MILKFFPFEKKEYIFALIDMEIAYEMALNDKMESIFFFEHKDIYSAGKSFNMTEFLYKPQIPVYFPNRGGKITVHSKGQLVVYPIINLKKRNINVSEFVSTLEQWMIAVLKVIGVEASVFELGRGICVKGEKIGFVGINITKGVARHGLCLNISNNLLYFNSIVPCGIKGIEITSLEKLGISIQLDTISNLFKETCPF